MGSGFGHITQGGFLRQAGARTAPNAARALRQQQTVGAARNGDREGAEGAGRPRLRGARFPGLARGREMGPVATRGGARASAACAAGPAAGPVTRSVAKARAAASRTQASAPGAIVTRARSGATRSAEGLWEAHAGALAGRGNAVVTACTARVPPSAGSEEGTAQVQACSDRSGPTVEEMLATVLDRAVASVLHAAEAHKITLIASTAKLTAEMLAEA